MSRRIVGRYVYGVEDDGPKPFRDDPNTRYCQARTRYGHVCAAILTKQAQLDGICPGEHNHAPDEPEPEPATEPLLTGGTLSLRTKKRRIWRR